jgi:hypothetical protein
MRADCDSLQRRTMWVSCAWPDPRPRTQRARDRSCVSWLVKLQISLLPAVLSRWRRGPRGVTAAASRTPRASGTTRALAAGAAPPQTVCRHAATEDRRCRGVCVTRQHLKMKLKSFPSQASSSGASRADLLRSVRSDETEDGDGGLFCDINIEIDESGAQGDLKGDIKRTLSVAAVVRGIGEPPPERPEPQRPWRLCLRASLLALAVLVTLGILLGVGIGEHSPPFPPAGSCQLGSTRPDCAAGGSMGGYMRS